MHEVLPFEIHVADHTLANLRTRLLQTRWVEDLADGSWDRGLSVPYMKDLVSYWIHEFDWSSREAVTNRLPQFQTTIAGKRIHFVHQYGEGPDPLALILTHGFPDSFLRFEKIVPMLADPASYGGDPADAFHVVVPSLPGYGFSERLEGDGGIFQVGDVWHELMSNVLGYTTYGAHGGDWGSLVTEILGRDHADAVVGIHMTDVPFYHAFQKPRRPSHAERKYLKEIEVFGQKQGAYALIQGAQPQALALGLNDSPAGLAGWIVEKWRRWSDSEGDVEARFTRDELLSNVMLYWVTETINSSFDPYYDVAQAGAMTWIKQAIKKWAGSTNVPAAFALFPKDLSTPPREWAERFFNVQRWTDMPRGGHFAALEEPELLVDDIRAFFRPLRVSANFERLGSAVNPEIIGA